MARKIQNQTSAYDIYLEMVEYTESPLIFHRWSFISAIGAAIGRNLWLPFGESNIFPNQFVVLVGPPGSRKSAALGISTSILRDTGYSHFCGDSSSREKFLLDLEHGFDKISKGLEPGDKVSEIDEMDTIFTGTGRDPNKVSQVYISSSELQDFLGGGSGGFISTLTNLWDNPGHYSDRFKNSKSLYIPNPTISLLGGATTTTFASIFNSNIIGQGMLSRMILVHGRGQRQRITIPKPLPAKLKGTIGELLMAIHHTLRGPVTLTEEAADALDYIYTNFQELPDSRLLYYGSRRLTHLLKLCIITAASELSTTIDLQTVITANSILSYTELGMPKALGEFGKSKNSEVSQVVLDAITAGEIKGGLTLIEILAVVGQDVESIHELSNITLKLYESKKIKFTSRGAEKVFVPVRKQIKSNSKYVDFDLLWEYRLKEADVLDLELVGTNELPAELRA